MLSSDSPEPSYS